jgi:hypothetical protein
MQRCNSAVHLRWELSTAGSPQADGCKHSPHHLMLMQVGPQQELMAPLIHTDTARAQAQAALLHT